MRSTAADRPAQLALALSYRAQTLLNQNKCDPAIEDLNRAKDVSPSKKSSAYYDLHLWISYYWQNCKGDFDRGIAVLNEAAAILPRDPAVYNQRANMYRDKGDYAAAFADINRSIALINNDPYRASAYNNRALILKTMGEYEKSAADFSVAIKLAPKNRQILRQSRRRLAAAPAISSGRCRIRTAPSSFMPAVPASPLA